MRQPAGRVSDPPRRLPPRSWRPASATPVPLPMLHITPFPSTSPALHERTRSCSLPVPTRRETARTKVDGAFMPHYASGIGYALDRLRRFVVPPVTITPPPRGVRFERDVPVAMRDGTILRVNVFRPAAEGQYPVVMCAHPYGKDRLPRGTPAGYLPDPQYRLMRQGSPVRFSAWTS